MTVNKGKRHIIYSWIILICFIAGQWAVYTHYHRTYKTTANVTHNHTTVSENCQLCDVMHHNNNMLRVDHHYTIPVTSSAYIYKQGHYDFVSIALILSAGRAPPVS